MQTEQAEIKIPSGKAATLSDIAREAGVSRFTVSAVLNGARSNTRVSEATRQRILTSARALRYQPNASARNLARQCTRTIGIVFGVVHSAAAAFSDNYASAILEGIVARAGERRYDVMLYTEPWRGEPGAENRYRDRRTDGAILVAPLTDSTLFEDLAATGTLPLVAISAAPDQARSLGVPSVDVDNDLGITLAVEHLASLGHTRIAHLTGNVNVYSATARRIAFETAIASAGLLVVPEYVVTCTYDGTTVPDVLNALLSMPNAPTALVAGNDTIAIAAARTVREKGLTVPNDFSIIGFDDIAAAAQVTPGLTTIRQPLRAIGAAAADLLIDRLDAAREASGGNAVDNSFRLIAPELIVRGSTAPISLNKQGAETPCLKEGMNP